MSTRLEDLALELLGLPSSDRALLARQLLSSLDDVATPDSQRLWLEEARRRAAEIQRGAECRPAKDVMRDVRERLQAPKK
jgi:phosphoribosylaminoimidazole-succinocarboxamide synthase